MSSIFTAKSLCSEKDKEIVFQDRGKCKYRAYNPKEYSVQAFKVDGGLIQDGVKCDYILLNNCLFEAFFVELKGSDIRHAKEQLETTARKLAGNLKNYSKFYRVVYRTGTHDLKDAAIVLWRKKLGKINGREAVIVKSMLLEETL